MVRKHGKCKPKRVKVIPSDSNWSERSENETDSGFLSLSESADLSLPTAAVPGSGGAGTSDICRAERAGESSEPQENTPKRNSQEDHKQPTNVSGEWAFIFSKSIIFQRQFLSQNS